MYILPIAITIRLCNQPYYNVIDRAKKLTLIVPEKKHFDGRLWICGTAYEMF